MAIKNAIVFRITCFAALVCLSGCATMPKLGLKNRPVSAAVIDSQLSLARLSERRDNSERSKEIYQKILKQSPDNPVALHRLGVILAEEGRIAESLESLARSNKLTPNADVVGDIGYVHFLEGNHAKADAALRESLSMDPHNKRALNNLALVTGKQGNYAESLLLFRSANEDAKAHANLAYVMTQNGDLDSAVNEYHRALDHDHDFKLAALALVQLESQATNRDTNERTDSKFEYASKSQLASYASDEQDADKFVSQIPNQSTPAGATLATKREPPVVDFRTPGAAQAPFVMPNFTKTVPTEQDSVAQELLVQNPYPVSDKPSRSEVGDVSADNNATKPDDVASVDDADGGDGSLVQQGRY